MPPAVPPAPAATPAPAPAPVPIAEVLLKAVPEKLQNLPRPVLLPGTVVGQTPEGLVQVRTQAGEVLLKSPTPLLTNQSILLQILAGNPPAKATAFASPVLTAPQTGAVGAGPATATAARLGAAAQGMASPAPAAAMLTLRPGMVLPAIALSVAPGLTLPGNPQPGLAAGAPSPNLLWGNPGGALEAGARFGQPQPHTGLPGTPGGNPAAGATPGGGTAAPPGGGTAAPPGTGESGSPGMGTGGPGRGEPGPGGTGTSPQTPGPHTPGSPVTPGSTVALKVLEAQAPGGLAASAPAMAADDADGAPVLSGSIARSTPNGQPILATPRGTFVLATTSPVAQGTLVTVALANPAQVLASGLAQGEAEALSGDPKSWPAFRKAFSALATLDPAMAQSLVNTVLPQPNRRLGAALLFFLSAARSGDANTWLGDEAAHTLEKGGRRDVLAHLGEEFRALSRQAAEPPSGDWKPYQVPFLDGETIARLALHVRPVDDDEDRKGAKERSARGSRFLLDVDLTQLGPLQLDGLVRPRRFDLIIRSRLDLPEQARRDLPQIFTNCLEAVGYTGLLSFQSGGRGWVTVQPKAPRGVGPQGVGVSA